MTPLLSLSCSGKLNRTVSITLFFPRTLSGHPSRQAVTSSGKRIRPLKGGERKGERGQSFFLAFPGQPERYWPADRCQVIQREILDPLSIDILNGKVREGQTAYVDVKDGKLEFREK